MIRLVKGDGEIVEEIVSREQQKNINKVLCVCVCVCVCACACACAYACVCVCMHMCGGTEILGGA